VKKFVDESWLVLVLSAVFAVMLAGAQTTLSPKIKVNVDRALNQAIGEIVPGTATTEVLRIEGYERDVYRCLDAGGKTVGWAVDALGVGFADKIRLVFGLSVDGQRVTGLKVIENVETPGLGNKIAAEGADAWAGQFKDLKAGTAVVLTKKKRNMDNNEIQAITGATISSTAVTKIVNDALALVRSKLPKE
jgi:electron transport complex protein RnfG